ncbi:transglycosylase SLT domain-containing protein [Dactylosporangium sp. CS-033363]|uniref:transglycosylase SLT domain-containing protein n=1 Tax=Dactylosporangium sp. CS-033363 TaxID=3239935 RepID=UPI003D92F94B
MTVLDAQSRIAEIRSMLGLHRPTATDAASGFANALRSEVDGAATAAPALGRTTPVSGTAVVEAAQKYAGTPYKFGSNTPESGLDCSGLVQRAYADVGIKLPRTARDQASFGTAVPSLAQARPGDLLAFGRPVNHIAIYAGNNTMVVAPHTGEVVKTERVTGHPTAIRRVIPVSTTPALRPAALSTTQLPESVPYADLFQAAGTRYGVPPALLAAVAKVESGYNPNAVSRAGAQGLMQIMPSTARGLGVDALNPAQAVDGAARLLSSHLKQFGNVDLALAAYNAGGSAVSRYGGIPPFAETQAYVPKVKAALAALTATGHATESTTLTPSALAALSLGAASPLGTSPLDASPSLGASPLGSLSLGSPSLGSPSLGADAASLLGASPSSDASSLLGAGSSLLGGATSPPLASLLSAESTQDGGLLA